MADALAFVVTFHRRRFLALAKPENEANDNSTQTGWRPFRWVDRLDDAQKWTTEPNARAVAEKFLPGGYEIRPIYGASPRSAA